MKALLLLMALVTSACWQSKPLPGHKPARTDGPPNVILVVLDTVRSDHLSLCGYERPTTPYLEQLAAEGAAYTCDGQAPGSWTLPSHASFFTGKPPDVHHAHATVTGAEDLSGQKGNNRKLDRSIETLATKMQERGYQTAALSANPVVNHKSGLLAGFEYFRHANEFGVLFGRKYRTSIAYVMNKVDRSYPVFAFFNIANAHRPLRDVPDDVDWLPPAKKIPYIKTDEEGVWQRYVKGTMDPEEQAQLIEETTALYDWGIRQADDNLRYTMTWLQENQWCEAGCRVVIVSDHGEFLGEHQLLDHGHYVRQANVRVPVMAFGDDVVDSLPSPMNAIDVHQLALDGTLPESTPVISMAWPHIRRCARTDYTAFCHMSAALWKDDHRYIWDGENYWELDATDLDEAAPRPITPEHEAFAELSDIQHRLEADAGFDEIGEEDQSLNEMLEALGYAD